MNKRTNKADSASATSLARRRRVKVRAGQLVAVPLADGSFGLAHVAAVSPGITCAAFSTIGSSVEILIGMLGQVLEAKPIAIMTVTSNRVTDGDWPVIGQMEPRYPAEQLDTRGRSSTAGSLEEFLNAYHGLVAWDKKVDPRYFEKRLLPGVAVPPTIRYKRDLEEHAARTSESAMREQTATEDGGAVPLSKGPGEVHIELKYAGEELPTIELLKRRQSIEQALESAGVGEVTDAGGGGGVMDIYLETEDVARALAVARAAIQKAGFEGAARIEVNPLDTESDDQGLEDATAEEAEPRTAGRSP